MRGQEIDRVANFLEIFVKYWDELAFGLGVRLGVEKRGQLEGGFYTANPRG
jgi:hypothetical protein